MDKSNKAIDYKGKGSSEGSGGRREDFSGSAPMRKLNSTGQSGNTKFAFLRLNNGL